MSGIIVSWPVALRSTVLTSAEIEMRSRVDSLVAVECNVLDGKMTMSSSSGSRYTVFQVAMPGRRMNPNDALLGVKMPRENSFGWESVMKLIPPVWAGFRR